MPTLAPERFRRPVNLPPIAVTQDTADWVRDYSNRHGITITEVLRAALAHYRDETDARRTPPGRIE